MRGVWNGTKITLPVASTDRAFLTILFTQGGSGLKKKQVTIKDSNGIVVGSYDNCTTRRHLHKLDAAGQPYDIFPEYFDADCNAPGTTHALIRVLEASDSGTPNTGFVTHRKFSISGSGNDVDKTVITILIEDNDFGPDIGFPTRVGRGRSQNVSLYSGDSRETD